MSPPATISDDEASSAYVSAESDHYGSEWGEDGEAQLLDLLDDIELLKGEAPLMSLNENESVQMHARVPARQQTASKIDTQSSVIQIKYDDDIASHESRSKISQNANEAPSRSPDKRSPLQRFRSPPKKPLSVTDLVSPAWCELQYWFNLTRFGKKPATPAMKLGSSVHKTLEEQVYQFVPIDVRTREDSWGLRIWNIVQGLRTLRVTGMTRELEVWGTIDGQVINGVIDVLSHTSTDQALEDSLESASNKNKHVPPPNQASIQDFFGSQRSLAQQTPLSSQTSPKKVYLTDVKTRGHRSLPKGASLRPTHMQLMLYHKLLSRLACGEVNPNVLFDRYSVNKTVSFSDSMIAQLSTLDLGGDSLEMASARMEAKEDPLSQLLSHNCLQDLWGLMIEEFKMTFPLGPASLSRVLQAEFRASGDGGIIGSRTFIYDDHVIENYVKDELRWWKGEREAKGVDLEEAFKCRMCEFAEGCSWRIEKLEEDTKRSRQRKSTSQKPDS